MKFCEIVASWQRDDKETLGIIGLSKLKSDTRRQSDSDGSQLPVNPATD